LNQKASFQIITMSYNHQLTPVEDFKTDNILFSKPEIGNIPGQKISFKRIRIAIQNRDNTVGDFILSTPEYLHSFGLQEAQSMDSGKLNGYVLPICLWSRNGPKDSEKRFTDVFTEVSEFCKKYLIEHREEIEKYDLDFSDLKKFNPLFWKTEKGKIVEGRGPMLYCKVLMNKKNNKINTIFVDEDTNQEIDPFTIMNKPCHVTAAIKIESIFVGNKISLQVKLYEVVVKQIDNTMRGLLRPNASKREEIMVEKVSNNPYECIQYHSEEEEDDENGDVLMQSSIQYEEDHPISDHGSIILEDEVVKPSDTSFQEYSSITTGSVLPSVAPVDISTEKKKTVKSKRK